MFYHQKIAIVIPAYRVERWIQTLLKEVPAYIDYIIVVDDSSDDKTSEKVKEVFDSRVQLIKHAKNRGVGGAMKTGFQEAMKLGADICVKIDGDGQMSPSYLPALLYPLVLKECDYIKGNRFTFLANNRSMPWIRQLGSHILTFLNKFSSGYWHIFDPQNGYVAIRTNCLRRIPMKWIDESYFFENSMLISLNIIEARVSDVFIPSRYGEEESSMKILWVLRHFPIKLIRGFFHRVFFRYIYKDISPVSIMLFLGTSLMLGGVLWGVRAWYLSYLSNVEVSLGGLALGLIPILLGFQLLLSALLQDIQLSISGRQRMYDFSDEDLKIIVEDAVQSNKGLPSIV